MFFIGIVSLLRTFVERCIVFQLKVKCVSSIKDTQLKALFTTAKGAFESLSTYEVFDNIWCKLGGNFF